MPGVRTPTAGAPWKSLQGSRASWDYDEVAELARRWLRKIPEQAVALLDRGKFLGGHCVTI